MERRQYLAISGATLTAALAGCTGSDDDEEPESEPDTEPDSGTDDDIDEEPEPEPEGEDDAEEEEEEDDGPERSDDDQLMSIRDTLDSDEPLFDPGTESFDGSGQSVTDEFNLSPVLTLVTFDHDGDSNFAINLEGPTEDLLVNTIGSIEGAAAVAAERGDHLLDIEADGDWSVSIGQPIAPEEEIRTPPVSASGDGPDVVGPLELSEAVTFAGEHQGDSNFAINVFDEEDSGTSGELVFNEIGEFEGETRVDYPGVVWIDVEANGDWSLNIE